MLLLLLLLALILFIAVIADVVIYARAHNLPYGRALIEMLKPRGGRDD